MRFRFSAELHSPSYASVFHLMVREAGGKPWFEKDKVVTEYEGTTEDKEFKALLELYEKEPRHTITLWTH